MRSNNPNMIVYVKIGNIKVTDQKKFSIKIYFKYFQNVFVLHEFLVQEQYILEKLNKLIQNNEKNIS